jgi:hypothetical protein
MNIDYTKLNDHIVKQAYRGFPTVLDEKEKHRLIREKIERAAQYHRSLNGTVYHQIDD